MKVRNFGCLVVAGAAVIALSACDTDPRDNQPRPPIPAGISVHVTDDGLDLAPDRVGFGPESRQQVIVDERDGELQSDRSAPMPVKLTVANTTRQPIRVELVGPARRVLPPVTATGTEVISTQLPSGNYEVRVRGSSAGGSELTVGPDRSSPQNDLLMP